MSKKSTSTMPDDALIRAKDIAAGKLSLRKRGASGAVLPAKQRVNIYLDSAIVEHFKAEAGERGYQTLINEALKLSGAHVLFGRRNTLFDPQGNPLAEIVEILPPAAGR